MYLIILVIHGKEINLALDWLDGQGWYNNAIMVHPFDVDILFVGGVNLYKIIIDGTTATEIPLNYDRIHSDHHHLQPVITDSSNQDFFIISANDGGIYLNEDGKGTSWSERNRGYITSQYYSVDRHPFEKKYLGGTQDNGSHFNAIANPNHLSEWIDASGGDGFDVIWNKDDPNKLITTSTYATMYRSLDEGQTWSVLFYFDEINGHFMHQLDNYKSNPNAIYSLKRDQLRYSFDFGDHWKYTTLPESFENYVYSFTDIRISRANPSVIWISTAMINNIVSPIVSVDSGRTFTETNYFGEVGYYTTGIATHPTELLTAYILSSVSNPKVVRTKNLGNSWENISSNLPDIDVFCLLVIPDTTKKVFPLWLGTELGIFVSEDDGESWHYSDFGLPAVSVWELKRVENEIIAATHGRGIWSLKYDNLLNNDDNIELQLNVIESFIQNPSYQEHAYFFRRI